MTGDFNRLEQRLESIERRLEEGFSRPASLVLDEVLGLEQRTNERLDRLTERVDRLTERVDDLAQSQQRTQNTVDQLAQMMGRILPAIEEMQTEVRGLQVENRRILDRLFGEQPG